MNTHSPDAFDVVEALPDVQSLSVALVGYGEVGRILGAGLTNASAMEFSRYPQDIENAIT